MSSLLSRDHGLRFGHLAKLQGVGKCLYIKSQLTATLIMSVGVLRTSVVTQSTKTE